MNILDGGADCCFMNNRREYYSFEAPLTKKQAEGAPSISTASINARVTAQSVAPLMKLLLFFFLPFFRPRGDYGKGVLFLGDVMLFRRFDMKRVVFSIMSS